MTDLLALNQSLSTSEDDEDFNPNDVEESDQSNEAPPSLARLPKEESTGTEECDDELPVNLPKTIIHYMPQIFWHDRKQIMSVHVQQTKPPDQYVSAEGRTTSMCYKICTASVQHEVRVWELVFCKSTRPGFEQEYEMGVNFVANLVGHSSTLNLAQYSPNGKKRDALFLLSALVS
jgi:hypothetical protein